MAIVSARLGSRRRDVETVIGASSDASFDAARAVVGWKGDADEREAAALAASRGVRLILLSPAWLRVDFLESSDRPLGYRVEGIEIEPLGVADPDDAARALRELADAEPGACDIAAPFDLSDPAAIWLDPYDRNRIGLDQALFFAEQILRHRRRTRTRSFAVGLTRWKRPIVTRFLSGAGGAPAFAASAGSAAAEARAADGRIVVWASRKNRGVDEAARSAGVPVSRIEDGFLRSVGLGSAFVEAASLVLDGGGIYYDPSSRSDLETILADAEIAPRLAARAARLRERLVAQRMTKYNLGETVPRVVPEGRFGVLAPGQVEDDASILRGAGVVKTNLALLEAARARRPEAFIVYKPHPDVVAGYRSGAVDEREARRFADAIVDDGAISDLYAQCAAVETMTSLAGFEALLRGLDVTTHGQPFYAGWGLTEDLSPHPRRGRKRSLDELVAAALILYPLYLDPVSGLPCGPETLLDRLIDQRARAATGSGRLAARLRHAYALTRHRLLGPIARRLQ